MSAIDGSIGISRKRRRMSPAATSARISQLDIPEHIASLNGVVTEDTKTTDKSNENGKGKHSLPCSHEQELRILHTDLDSMRQLITCNICQRFMYEPYALPCGHTYCYSCLAEWMGKNHKKTCPDCRTYVKQEPTPAFLIREMVQIFVNRTQLLPDGETSEEHHQMAREEADIITKDRADTDERQGGLFKGTFSRPSARALIAVHDTSDHVDRCPNCLHEVEDGWCLICHVRVRASDADSDDSESDVSDDGSGMSGVHEFLGPWDDDGTQVYDESSQEEEPEAEDDEHDLTGFVEDEVRWGSDADEPDYSFEAVDYDTPQARRPAPVSDVPDSEDDSDDAERVQPGHRRLVNRSFARSVARVPVTISSDPGSSDEEDGNPVRRPPRRRHRYVDLETDDEDASDADPSENGTEGGQTTNAGFSPLQDDSDGIHVNPITSEDGSSSDGEENDLSDNDESTECSDDDGLDETGESGSDEDSGESDSTASGYSG